MLGCIYSLPGTVISPDLAWSGVVSTVTVERRSIVTPESGKLFPSPRLFLSLALGPASERFFLDDVEEADDADDVEDPDEDNFFA